MTILDEQLKFAESILLNGEKFDDERRRFILCLDKSIDLVACPGSGKTTALLAKLIALSELMPLDDGRGVCVLTHTNVAIDEIKSKLGAKSTMLFAHPNFFGTIQSFVDKFLAIPEYKVRFNKNINVIDNQRYENAHKSKFWDLSSVTKNRFYGLAKYSDKKAIDIFVNMKLNFETEKYINGIGGGTIYADKNNSGYIEINAIKNNLLKNGILSYEDAYLLSNTYIHSHIEIIHFFQKRFHYIFIDEMQDTDVHQLNIINQLFPFDSDKIVVQRIGDPNQAIYNDSSEKDENGWNPDLNAESTYKFSKSMRFGDEIASRIKCICRNDISNEFVGDGNKSSIIPHIIIFDNERKANVIPKFIELINRFKIEDEKNKKFKVVGRVGTTREDEKYTIKSFYTAYSPKNINERNIYDNLISYLRKPKLDNLEKRGVKCYADIFYNIFIEILYRADCKSTLNRNFTKTTLISEMAEKDEVFCIKFKSNFVKWALMLNNGESFAENVYFELKKYVIHEFVPFWSIAYSKIKHFIENQEISIPIAGIETSNIFVTEMYPQTKVYIDTIHGVKGETHKATLYLDTYFYEYDSAHFNDHFLIPYINNNQDQKRKKKALKFAHVAMSRASDLLCIAIEKENIPLEIINAIEYSEQNNPQGWIINRELIALE
ncbi:MAG TPA: UvrD-helicase domain-containing protein [Paludibacter sp.]